MEGVGTDIERGGQKVQDASRKVRQEWRETSARNEREYDAARAACAGTRGAEHDACMDRARREHPRSSMRVESDKDRREDAYDAARDRCDAMRGDAEDACIADAHRRFQR